MRNADMAAPDDHAQMHLEKERVKRMEAEAEAEERLKQKLLNNGVLDTTRPST